MSSLSTIKVYKIYPRLSCYGGHALVAAETAEEANEFIREFKKDDRDNSCDSNGYGEVQEDDVIENLCTNGVKGIVDFGIYYTG